MNETLELLTKYGPAISVIGAAIAFAWSVVQFFSVRTREARFREFETFHKLIKEPTEVTNTNNYRQIAVLFELRFTLISFIEHRSNFWRRAVGWIRH